jgi:hypothetical protein
METTRKKENLKAQLFIPILEPIFRTDSVVGTDGPVNYSGSYTSVGNIISIESRLKKDDG